MYRDYSDLNKLDAQKRVQDLQDRVDEIEAKFQDQKLPKPVKKELDRLERRIEKIRRKFY